MKLRTLIKESVYGSAHVLGAAAIGRWRLGGGLIVLTYHSVSEGDDHPYVNRMPVSRFRTQVAYLKKHYDLVTVEEGLRRLSQGDMPSARPMAAITVDDGYSDNYELMFPVLCEHEAPASFFVATDYIDSGRLPWPTRIGALLTYATERQVDPSQAERLGMAPGSEPSRRGLRQTIARIPPAAREEALQMLEAALAPRPFSHLAPMTWDQLRQMRLAGMSIGSHTEFHSWLDMLTAADIEAELSTSKTRIEEELDTPCRTIAYPNGNWNDAVVSLTNAAGYDFALTQDRGVNRPKVLAPLKLNRIEIPFNERIGCFACRTSAIAY